MKEVTEDQKEVVTKSFAVVGFVAIVLLIVYLAVQIVSFVPSAFSSLASIADSVYSKPSGELTVATKNSVVNSGESFTVSWTQLKGDGTYSFSYECTDGVAVDVRKGSGGITTVPCNTPHDLGNATAVDVLIASEKQRFTDVPYSITYSSPNLEEDITVHTVITIVNASIPTSAQLAEEEEVDDEEEKVEGEVAGESTDGSTGSTAGEPTTIENIVYKIPVSDPHGDIDLKVTHQGVGTLSGSTFTPKATIDKDVKGAIRFEIKNIGTKTADNWSYEANLPSDITYESGAQVPLKPNEKAIITLGFEGITKSGVEVFGVEVTAKNDIKNSNNKYSWTVTITD